MRVGRPSRTLWRKLRSGIEVSRADLVVCSLLIHVVWLAWRANFGISAAAVDPDPTFAVTIAFP